MKCRTLIGLLSIVAALELWAGEVVDPMDGFATVQATADSEQESIDLSPVWAPTTLPASDVIAYSATGWGDGLVGGTVRVYLYDPRAGASTDLVIGKTDEGTFAWDFAGVRRQSYQLVHEVTRDGAVSALETLTANYDFTDCELPQTDDDFQRALRGFTQSCTVVNDVDNNWKVIGGEGAGVKSPTLAAGTTTAITLTAFGIGDLSFAYRLTGGSAKVTLDGEDVLDLAAAADWTPVRVAADEHAAHTFQIVYTAADGGQMFLNDLVWALRSGAVRAETTGGLFRADIRLGYDGSATSIVVRVVSKQEEMMPFVYSATNFTGLAETVEGPTVAKVSVVKLTGEGEEVALWTDEVPGTRRVIRHTTGESAISWNGRTGAWKAEFEILDGDKSVHFESAIFDMRAFKKGFVLFVR